jgi:sporulation protein YlmC with PRC-barrel domain
MLKKHMAACLVATAFVAAPALAQTSTVPSSSQPATSAQSSQPQSTTASAQSGQFMTQMQPQQIRASKLVGVDIIGANNESIGDVNDLILDQQGMPQAVVIGVGGFLGIGEKNVAVPFKSVEWKWERREPATTAGTGAGGTAGTGAGGTAGTGAGTAGTASAPTGGTAGTTGSTGTAGGTARSDANRGAPDHGVLRMSKADLQNAPEFSYDGDRNRGSGTGGSGGTTGTGTNAPRQ